MPKRPDVETQRAILTQARDTHVNKAFGCDIDLECLTVQTGINDDNIEAERRKLENLRANSLASAAKCDELLAKLPKPSPDPATRKK